MTNEDILAAEEYMKNMIDEADYYSEGFYLFHEWRLFNAFVAGMKYKEEKRGSLAEVITLGRVDGE